MKISFYSLCSLDYDLTKNEVVAFLNTLGKLSESLTYIKYFESLLASNITHAPEQGQTQKQSQDRIKLVVEPVPPPISVAVTHETRVEFGIAAAENGNYYQVVFS